MTRNLLTSSLHCVSCGGKIEQFQEIICSAVLADLCETKGQTIPRYFLAYSALHLQGRSRVWRQRVVVHGHTKRFLLHINLNLDKTSLLLDSQRPSVAIHTIKVNGGVSSKFSRTAILSALIHDISVSGTQIIKLGRFTNYQTGVRINCTNISSQLHPC